MREQWRDVAGWVGAYQVSDCGNVMDRVRSLDRVIVEWADGRAPRAMRGRVLQGGYV